MDEQLKNLKFDMDEEVAERERHFAQRRRAQPLDISHAIILGAIIIVVGIWGGKIYYDYLQEQRAKAALEYLARSLNPPMQESTPPPAQDPTPRYQPPAKPIATQAAEALQPAAKAFSHAVSQTGLEFMAGTDGPMGDGARAALKQQARIEQRDQIGNTNIVRSLKECMKPGNVVDNEVKACTEGRLEKTW
ncbi:hypothetical protein [Pseudomonas panipatensis]|uniref:Uncharacterized protein n=1 Tax=Pseudomonas panipatensis TaxID=428992 RepID=A0A1G8GM79_9PSED|nr:hypothetical protein [Pseudomonas panipatensis]SDH95515.1 hypothetical protein SAMN05216272_104363 [Pseudomonas panipatensis]SMP42489.1 hypothetical protein SAMN06295951_101622 [Pseudomonas panipatensis]